MIKIEVKYDSVEKPFEYVFENTDLDDSDFISWKISRKILFGPDYKDFRKNYRAFIDENKMTRDDLSSQRFKALYHLVDKNGNSLKSVPV